MAHGYRGIIPSGEDGCDEHMESTRKQRKGCNGRGQGWIHLLRTCMPPRNCFQLCSPLHHTALSNAFIVRLHQETNALFSSESSGSVSGNCITDTQRNALYHSSTTDKTDQRRRNQFKHLALPPHWPLPRSQQ